jgi:hypothetical protein
MRADGATKSTRVGRVISFGYASRQQGCGQYKDTEFSEYSAGEVGRLYDNAFGSTQRLQKHDLEVTET